MNKRVTAASDKGAPPAAPENKFRFAIENDVPLPEKRSGPRGDTGYPYAALEIGQSFFVPSSDTMKEPWKTLTSMSSREGRNLYPKQFTTARITVSGVEGVRIWRKADAEGPQKPPKVLNRKPKEGSAAALAKEAVDGDTSNRRPPEDPNFDPPPPPPPVS